MFAGTRSSHPIHNANPPRAEPANYLLALSLVHYVCTNIAETGPIYVQRTSETNFFVACNQTFHLAARSLAQKNWPFRLPRSEWCQNGSVRGVRDASFVRVCRSRRVPTLRSTFLHPDSNRCEQSQVMAMCAPASAYLTSGIWCSRSASLS